MFSFPTKTRPRRTPRVSKYFKYFTAGARILGYEYLELYSRAKADKLLTVRRIAHVPRL